MFAARIFLRKSGTLFESIHRTYSSTQKSINLSSAAVQQYLKGLMVEHEKILLKTKRTNEDINRLSEIKPIVQVLEQRIALFDNIESLKQLNKKDGEDPEIKKMIKEEAEIYLTRVKQVDGELMSILLEPYLTDGGVLVEIVAGAGGQESMLFSRELFDMYLSYSDFKDWQADVATIDESDIGGIRKASLLIQGYGVSEIMKLEAGVHRVQRIPTTEKGGRIHTSTAIVAVLPQPTDINLDIPERDLKIETKRASGAGGQHVNTTDSAVRIIHVPSGTSVECQEGRSQIKNKEIALQKLRSILLQKQIDEQFSQIQSERKSQMGSGERNEKIRTYNYPQDRITEHRPGGGTYHNLRAFMEGSAQLEDLHYSLIRQQKYDNLMSEVDDYIKSNKLDIA